MAEVLPGYIYSGSAVTQRMHQPRRGAGRERVKCDRSNRNNQAWVELLVRNSFHGPRASIKSQSAASVCYGKTREGVPYSVFFEGRGSLGSRRLKCGGFGLQHLWFCYRSATASRTRMGVVPRLPPVARHCQIPVHSKRKSHHQRIWGTTLTLTRAALYNGCSLIQYYI